MPHRFRDRIRELSTRSRSQLLAEDPVTGECLYGDGNVEEYRDVADQSRQLSWFREAVHAVREQFEGARLEVNRIVLVDQLFSGSPDVVQLLPHGKVVYSARPTLYFPRPAIKGYLARFEEAAHSQSCPQDFGRGLSQHRLWEAYSRLFQRQFNKRLSGRMKAFLPIVCHLQIYKAFERSHFFAVCSPEERRRVEFLIKQMEPNCRNHSSDGSCGC